MDVVKKTHNYLRGTSIVALYFVQEGFLYKAFQTVLYPLYGQYFNIAGHQFNSLRSIYSLAWSLKMFFSFLSDSVPIFGYRRIPYITIGLSTILVALSILCFKPMPDPYYQLSEDGTKRLLEEPPLNPDAHNQALVYIMLFFLWYMGLSCADSTIDGLMTQRSKLEPEETRGSLISYTRISSQIGAIFAFLTVGFLLNTVKYGGTFVHFGIEFNQYMYIPFVITVGGMIYAFFYTNEKDVDRKGEQVEFGKKLKQLWLLFHRWNYLKLMIFALCISIQWSMRTPAAVKVQKSWAQVEPLVASLVSVLTCLAGGIGMIVYVKCFLHSNWRYIIVLVIILQVLFEFPVVSLTVFDVFRNQYFWFVDDVFETVIRFWFFYVIELIIVEYAPDGIEGISYAFLWTVMNIGRVMGGAIGNFIMSPFCLTEDFRYLRDSDNDRMAVWYSYIISYGFQLMQLVTVLLIPKQKQQAQEWRKRCEEEDSGKSWSAPIFVCFGVVGLVGATSLNIMTMFDSTRCMVIVGGPGCGVSNVTEQKFCILS